ncbi:MAG: hypothetical protein JWL98_1678 [Xanthomonadaceae bacterium]|nr:hypothetical protein [Xanthomonadaceae bacterium]
MANLMRIPLMRWLMRLRYPKLFLVIAALFVVDLAIPNLVPWDDILLGVATLMLARWKDRDKGSSKRSDDIDATGR